MAHPFRGEAAGTSREKMRAITGRGGGGSPFLGMSSFKRPNPDGAVKSYHGHDKQFVLPGAHGGKVKRRADKFARGGVVKKAEGGKTQYPKSPLRLPGPGSKEGQDWYQKLSGRGSTGVRDPIRDADELAESGSLKKGGRAKRQEGGRLPAKGRTYGWGDPISAGPRRGGERASGPPPTSSSAAYDTRDLSSPEFREDRSVSSAPLPDLPEQQQKRGGRAKRADGGRTMPYGPGPQRSTVRRGGKGKGNVNIAIMMPPSHHPGAGAGLGAGMPPPLPPGGAGAGPGAGPPNPAPAIPPALMGGGMPPGGAPGMGAPGMGAPGGGMNPAALQALAGIAGGAGGPMGAGMPGRGPFARGGGVKSTGLSSNLGHWREYASRNVKGNTAHNRGATGESEELPLRTPDKVAGASDDAVARKRGDRGRYAKGGKVAKDGGGKPGIKSIARPLGYDQPQEPLGLTGFGKGGRKHARGGKIPVKIRGGSETGVGRKEMAKIQPSWR